MNKASATFFAHSRLESIIIETLSSGPLPAQFLVENISGIHSCSKKGVYSALNKLKNKEIVVEVGKACDLSFLWVQELRRMNNDIIRSHENFLVNEKMFKDFKEGKRRSVTIKCDNIQRFDLVFNNIMYSLTSKSNKKRPFYFFGFAPWFFTLYQKETRAYFDYISSLNYIPCSAAQTLCDRDQDVTKEARKLGGQHNNLGTLLADNFEGNYFDDICIQAIYNKKQFEEFKKAYATLPANGETNKLLRDLINKFSDITIKVSRKPHLFSKRITDKYVF
jgi:hypothetical protein